MNTLARILACGFAVVSGIGLLPAPATAEAIGPANLRFTDTALPSLSTSCTGVEIPVNAIQSQWWKIKCVEVSTASVSVASNFPPAEYQLFDGPPASYAVVGASCTGNLIPPMVGTGTLYLGNARCLRMRVAAAAGGLTGALPVELQVAVGLNAIDFHLQPLQSSGPRAGHCGGAPVNRLSIIAQANNVQCVEVTLATGQFAAVNRDATGWSFFSGPPQAYTVWMDACTGSSVAAPDAVADPLPVRCVQIDLRANIGGVGSGPYRVAVDLLPIDFFRSNVGSDGRCVDTGRLPHGSAYLSSWALGATAKCVQVTLPLGIVAASEFPPAEARLYTTGPNDPTLNGDCSGQEIAVLSPNPDAEPGCLQVWFNASATGASGPLVVPIKLALPLPKARFVTGSLGDDGCDGAAVPRTQVVSDWILAPDKCVEVRIGSQFLASELPPAEYGFFDNVPSNNNVFLASCTGNRLPDPPTTGDLEPLTTYRCLQIWVNATGAGHVPGGLAAGSVGPITLALDMQDLLRYAYSPPDAGEIAADGTSPAFPLLGLLAGSALAAGFLRRRVT